MKFRPSGNLNVSDLGEPSIAISQNHAFISPDNIVVDGTNNCVYADLTEEDTIQLTANVQTKAQLAFVKNEQVVRFPIHDITVKDSIMWTLIGGE